MGGGGQDVTFPDAKRSGVEIHGKNINFSHHPTERMECPMGAASAGRASIVALPHLLGALGIFHFDSRHLCGGFHGTASDAVVKLWCRSPSGQVIHSIFTCSRSTIADADEDWVSPELTACRADQIFLL